jgi:hypothetical protein
MKSEILQSIDWQNKFMYWQITGKAWIPELHTHFLAKGETCKICNHTNTGSRMTYMEARQIMWEENHREETIENDKRL